MGKLDLVGPVLIRFEVQQHPEERNADHRLGGDDIGDAAVGCAFEEVIGKAQPVRNIIVRQKTDAVGNAARKVVLVSIGVRHEHQHKCANDATLGK